jgi:hypothetical protein
LRYVLARCRARVEVLDIGKDVKKRIMNAVAAVAHREHRAGRLEPGRRLERLADELCDSIDNFPGDDLWDAILDANERYEDGTMDEPWEDDWRVLAWAYWKMGEAQRATAIVSQAIRGDPWAPTLARTQAQTASRSHQCGLLPGAIHVVWCDRVEVAR